MIKLVRRLFQGVLWLGVLAIVAVGALWGAQTLLAQPGDELTSAQPLPVRTVTVRMQETYQSRRLFPGRIDAAQVADLSFQVNGEVAEVLAEVGDQVEAGQLLAEIDPVRLRFRTDEARAAEAEARAEFERAEAALARTRQLAGEGFATAQELDDSLAARNAARERVVRLTRTLETAEEDLRDSSLTAPYTGIVVTRYVDAGAVVNAGQPILRVNASGRLEAEIGVPADLIGAVGLGRSYELLTGDREVEGVVIGIGDDVDEATRTIAVKFEIDESTITGDGRPLIPGSLIRLGLVEELVGRGAWVPSAALAESYRGLWSVFVVVKEDGIDRIRRKDVEIVSIGDDRVFVTGTLVDGDEVVSSAPFRFVPGQRIERVDTPITPVASVR